MYVALEAFSSLGNLSALYTPLRCCRKVLILLGTVIRISPIEQRKSISRPVQTTSSRIQQKSNKAQQTSSKMSTTAVPKHLNFITGNKNKLAEVQAILAGVIELQNQNVDLVEIQGTVEEVTKDKARRAAESVRKDSLYTNIYVAKKRYKALCW
jgi:hypothetical protein